MQLLSWCNIYPYCCYLFLGSYKKKKIQKIYIKKYLKEILKIIGARKRCWNTEKDPKLVEEVQKCKRLKFDSIFLTGESSVDKKNWIWGRKV